MSGPVKTPVNPKKQGSIVILVAAVIAILLTACNPEIEIEYQPTGMPLRIAWRSGQGWETETASPDIMTPIGVFNVNANVPLPDVTEGVLLVLHDSTTNSDLYFVIVDRRYAVVNIDGNLHHLSDQRRAELDVTNANSVAIQVVGPDAQLVTEVRTPAPVTNSCPAAWPTRLAGVKLARVAAIQVYVHTAPGIRAPLVRHEVLAYDRRVAVVGGPVCLDASYWYEIDSGPITLSDNSQGTLRGWVAEADGSDWLLEPLEPAP